MGGYRRNAWVVIAEIRRLKALQQLPDDWTLSQCLFGEHLLPLCPELPVALVEAEKTAVICSAVFPEFLRLATGRLGGGGEAK